MGERVSPLAFASWNFRLNSSSLSLERSLSVFLTAWASPMSRCLAGCQTARSDDDGIPSRGSFAIKGARAAPPGTGRRRGCRGPRRRSSHSSSRGRGVGRSQGCDAWNCHQMNGREKRVGPPPRGRGGRKCFARPVSDLPSSPKRQSGRYRVPWRTRPRSRPQN